MTVLPGKRGRSVRYPGRMYRADLDTDLKSLRAAGIGRLFLLVEDDELARWSDPGIAARAATHDIGVHRHPMADGGVPASSLAMDELIEQISRARDGTDVAVACMGGVGRTGTVAACALVASGWSPDAAIRRVRELRHPTAVETSEQEAFVRSYRCSPPGPSATVLE